MIYKQFLNNILQPRLIRLPEPTTDGNYQLILEENNGKETYKIKILNVSCNSLLIKLDETIFETRKFLVESNKFKGILKRADFILVDPDIKRIIFIELTKQSSKNKPNIDVKCQLKGACSIFQYLKSIVKYYCDDSGTPPFESYENRYVLIRIIAKSLTQRNLKISDHSEIDKFKSIITNNPIPYKLIY